jgi:hypothetical protein
MGDAAEGAPAGDIGGQAPMDLSPPSHDILEAIRPHMALMDHKMLAQNALYWALGLSLQSQYDDDVDQNKSAAQADTFFATNVLTKTGPIAIRSLLNCDSLSEIAADLTMTEVRQNSFGKEMTEKTIGNKRADIKNQGIHMYLQLEKYVRG